MRIQICIFLGVAALASTLGRIDAQQPVPPVPPRVEVPPAQMQQMEQAAASAVVASKAGYLLRAGDELDIRSLLIPDLNQTVKVRPDGKISLVLVNEVDAAGHTPEELSKRLTVLYSSHFRNPELTVIVRSFANLNVYVGGEVQHPGLVPLGGGLTAAAAIFQAGGFKEDDGARNIAILRQSENGQPLVFNLDLADVLLRGKPDIPLQPSDVLFVPKTTINVYVGGEVVEPGLIPLNSKLTALSAVIKAKGLKNTAKPSQALLIRDSGGKPVVQKIDLKRVMARGLGDYALQPYDVIYIPKSKIAKLDLVVDQYIRQLIPIGMNLGFSYLLGQPVLQ